MRKFTISLLILLLFCGSANARFFGRRQQQQQQSTSQPNCPDGQCKKQGQSGLKINGNGGFDGQLPSSIYDQSIASPVFEPVDQPPIAPTPALTQEHSIVVEKITSLASAESLLAEAEAAVVTAQTAVARARQAADRKSAQEAILLQAEIDSIRLAQLNMLEDLEDKLQRLRPKLGGDLSPVPAIPSPEE